MKRLLLITALCLVCWPTSAVILYFLDAPQDDLRARRSLTNHVELDVLRSEFEELVETHFQPLKSNDVARILGPKLSQRPTDLVLPIFDSGSRFVSGGGGFPTHDMHAIGNLGYAEIYWYHTVYGEQIATVVFYHKADKQFVPLHFKEPFPAKLAWDKATATGLAKWAEGRLLGDGYHGRLGWDTARSKAIQEWLIAHFPKPVELGVVEVSTNCPTRIRLGTDRDALVAFNHSWPPATGNFAFSLSLAPSSSTNDRERQGSFVFHGVSRSGKSVSFMLDEQLFRMTPRLRSE